MVTDRSLAELETLLSPHGFERVHRRYLLNLHRVLRLEDEATGGYTAHCDDGATLPVSRCRTIHRSNDQGFSENRSATAVCESSPVSYARTARSRSSIGYGFGMCIRDHRFTDNSTEFWG